MMLLFQSLFLVVLLASTEAAHLRSRRRLAECPLTITSSCLVNEEQDCGSLQKQYSACEDAPTDLILRFYGGTCHEGYNAQELEYYQCVDYREIKENQDYVVTVTSKDLKTVYFDRTVHVGQDLVVDTNRANTVLADDLNVTIWESNDNTNKMVQSVVFHVSCQRGLFLNDFLGAFQLAGFVNAKQGSVSNFQKANLEWHVRHDGTSAAELDSVVISSDGEKEQLVFQNSEYLLAKATTTFRKTNLVLDLDYPKLYQVEVDIHGKLGDGSECTSTQMLQWEIRAPPTPAPVMPSTPVPTSMNPSAAPSVTPQEPTPTDPCLEHLSTTITCRDDQGNDCADLEPPTERECVGGKTPSKLTFQFTSQACSQSTHQQHGRFVCVDYEGQAEELALVQEQEQVYVAVNDEAPHLVSQLEEFTWIGNFGSYIHVQVWEADNGKPGKEVQTLKIGTRCHEGDDLSLMKHYGSLQLLGFENDEQGHLKSYADVTFTYQMHNAAPVSAHHLSAERQFDVTNLSPAIRALFDQNHPTLGSGETLQVEETERVDLLAHTDIAVRTSVTLSAELSGLSCQRDDVMTLLVHTGPIDLTE